MALPAGFVEKQTETWKMKTKDLRPGKQIPPEQKDLAPIEMWMASRSGLFSRLICLHTTTFIVSFSPLETISLKIWETLLSWHAKCTLPVAIHVSKM